MSEQNKGYGADSIQALEGMEHVRKRPSMYIGDVGIRGLHHLVYEGVDNSIDEAMAGHCNKIDVWINEDGSISCLCGSRILVQRGIYEKFKKEFVARTIETTVMVPNPRSFYIPSLACLLQD